MNPCPGHETLVRFLEDALGDAERQALEAHVEVCRSCAAALKRLTDAGQAGLPFPPFFLASPPAGAATRSPAGTEVGPGGRYQVAEQIGSGGMGAVHRGHDRRLGRDLAVKVLLDHHRANPAVAHRFVREAQLCSRLQHPGVVSLYELGELPDGRPFFTMRLVEGQTLAALLAARATPREDLPRFLGIFAQVAQTIAYAHSRGVIHRDLKPSNVMVGAFGEVQVMDWGLAKDLDASGEVPVAGGDVAPPLAGPGDQTAGGWGETRSQAGTVLGTPGYMPPEQARGEVDQLDRRSDVFGLGAILCVLLTGQPPQVATSDEELFGRARQGDLADAFTRLDRCGADAELVALARECLSPSPAGRPADAGVVARRVAAYQVGVAERLRRAELERAAARTRAVEARKRRLLRSLLAVATALLLLGGGGALGWYAYQRAVLREEAGKKLEEAEKSLKDGQWARAEAVLGQVEALLGRRGPDDLRRQQEELFALLKWAKELDQIRQERWTFADGQFNLLAGAPRYAESFARHGLAVGERDPEAIAGVVQESPIRAALIDALDDWQSADPRQGPALGAVLDRADPDPFRIAVRRATARKDLARLKELARQADPGKLSASAVVLLAEAVGGGESIELLRRARLAHRSDFWVAFTLGNKLTRHRRADLAGREQAFWAALAVRPDSVFALYTLGLLLHERKDLVGAEQVYRLALVPAGDSWAAPIHHGLGNVLLDRKDWAGAEEEFRQALAAAPACAPPWNGLGLVHLGRNDLPQAKKAFEQALRLDDGLIEVLCNLGITLHRQNALAEAEKTFRQALALNPKWASAWNGLGLVLRKRMDQAGAEKALREGLRLEPDNVQIHFNLATVLCDRKQPRKAEEALRTVLRSEPEHAEAHFVLGIILHERNDQAGAEKALRAAVRLAPDHRQAYKYLGSVLRLRNKPAEAEKAYRTAIRVDPSDPLVFTNLGFLLSDLGRFAEALEMIRRGHAMGVKRSNWPHPSAAWVRQTRRLVELDRRLPEVLRGAAPASPTEAVELGRLCAMTCRRQHFLAARLYAWAFAADPRLADDLGAGHREIAACCAVLCGCGKGPAEAREALRRQALTWLRADLAARTARRTRADREALQRWRQESALTGVREPAALARLPPAEREAWRAFWADVAREALQPVWRANAKRQACSGRRDLLGCQE